MEEKVPGRPGELKSQSADLVDEARANLRADRERLIKHLSALYDHLDNAPSITERVGFTESIAQVVDTLNKNNAQLVELAKIRAKTEMMSGGRFTGAELDDVYGDIPDVMSGPQKDHADA